jgi:exosortase/archaeosortase family protein
VEPERGKPGQSARESWYQAKGPALRFVLICGGLMLLFYGVFYTPPEENPALDAFIRGYLGAYASAAGFVLDLIGFENQVRGTTIILGERAVGVVRGCDAMEPIALYMAAVLALQVSWRSRLVGILGGVALLVLINLLRIIALTIVSARYSEHFETAHLTVGQTIFVVCTLIVWFLWALWASRRRPEHASAPA